MDKRNRNRAAPLRAREYSAKPGRMRTDIA